MEMKLVRLGKVVEVIFTGEFKGRHMSEHYEILNDECGKNPATGYLFNFSGVEGGMGTLDAYMLSQEIWLSQMRYKKVAILREEGVLENERFCVVTGRNRGLAVQAFESKKEALDWAQGND